MLRIAAGRELGLALCCFAGLGLACNNDAPPEPHAVNLGTADKPLLPLGAALVSARDERILSGQAELVKRGDTEAAEAARAGSTPVEAVAVTIEPASSLREAMSSIGNAFVANLASPSTVRAEAGEETEAAGTNGVAPAVPGGDLANLDVEALQQLVTAINERLASRKLSSLAEFAAASQKASSQAVFELLEELVASVNSVVTVAESVSPELKSTTETELNAVLGAWVLATPSRTDATTATGTITHGGAETSVRFIREDEQWRIEYAVMPAEADLPAARDNLQASIDRLDDLAEGAAAGTAVDATAAQDAVTAALNLLKTYLANG